MGGIGNYCLMIMEFLFRVIEKFLEEISQHCELQIMPLKKPLKIGSNGQFYTIYIF